MCRYYEAHLLLSKINDLMECKKTCESTINQITSAAVAELEHQLYVTGEKNAGKNSAAMETTIKSQ